MRFHRTRAWQREFEDAFEFEETPDQDAAIADVKRDMEAPAADGPAAVRRRGLRQDGSRHARGVQGGDGSKQVAMLAPTTVLVFQHFETFRRRIRGISRWTSRCSAGFARAREQKKSLVAMEAGKVDIMIGTHRLLSKDVKFHDLGLLIVDEEQRFGVAHKERLKEMSKNVDVLTLTATPIPRTLNMSLVGLRDMSVIETPPKDRLAIQTVVAPFSEGTCAARD